MPSRTSAAHAAPANLAPLVVVLAIAGSVVAAFFQLPGALVMALGLCIASFFYHAPATLNPKEPAPVPVQLAQRRWQELHWRPVVPSADWLLNSTDQVGAFRDRGKAILTGWFRNAPQALNATLGVIGEALGMLAWLVLPTRFVHLVALGAGLAVLTLPASLAPLAAWVPASLTTTDLFGVNALYAYGVICVVDGVRRRHSALADPSPGVRICVLTAKAAAGDGGAWRAFIGFGFLAALIAVTTLLVILAVGAGYLFVPVWLFGAGLGLAAAGGALHGVARTAALEPWRDRVAARAEWVPRWEAMKYPDVTMVDHQRVGSFVVDTFEAPPSLGSLKAINLYNTVVPYLAAGGDVTVAMLTVPATDSQGQPIPGSAHATRFRVVVAPGDADVKTLDPHVDVEELKLAAEVGAFTAAREVNADVPVLLDLTAAHTPDSPAAVWQTSWTVPLASAATVAWTLGVDPDTGIFSEGRSTFFGDFTAASLLDRTLPSRMEKAAYESRWTQRWTDALKMGEKQPHLQYGAIKREKLGTVELTYEPFLVGQGLNTAQFFSKDMRTRIITTLKAAPFLTVVGITGALAGNLGPGIRHGQGFAVVHAPSPLPANPADIASPGPRARDVSKWVLGGLVNRAFEDAKLPYPEVITAEALTRPQSQGHVWKLHLRLYDGVTAATLKLNAAKLAQSLGGVRWLRFEESEHGCYVVLGAVPHAEGVKFASPAALAYCDKLDWAQAFQDVGVRSVTDGSSPVMLENAPHETNPKITRLVFSMPAGLNLSKILETTDKLRSATANDYVDIRPGASPDRFVVLTAEQNPIPFPAVLDWEASADLAGTGEHAIPFAYTTDGSRVALNWKNDFHMMVLGGSGSGKSSFMQVLVAGAILRGCDIFVMDPTKGAVDFEFATPWIRGFAREGQHLGAGELTQRIGMEMEARKKLNGQYGVGNYRDLPEQVRPRHMFVVIDEFQSLIKEVSRGTLKAPDTTDEVELELFEQRKNINDGVRKLAMWVGKFGREARSVGITVVLAGQGIKADELKAVGLQGAKTNFSRVALGKMTFGDMSSAFKDVTILPNLGSVVPQGRGIFEGTSGDPLIIQSWFEPGGQEEMARRLRELVPPIDDADRIDVTALEDKVRSSGPKAFGAVVDDIVVDDEEHDAVTLVAAELGLDLDDLSFEDLDFTFEEPHEGESTPEEPHEDVFTLEEPPLGVAAAAEEPQEQEPTLSDPNERPLFHLGQFVDTPTGLGGRVVIGVDVVFGQDAPTGDGFDTGWPDGDALQLLLRANPAITELEWSDAALDELDDIGIPRRDIVQDICDAHQVTLVGAGEPESAPVPPEPAPAGAEALFDLDEFTSPVVNEPDFRRPAPAVPDMSEAADLFAPRRTNAPDANDITF